MSAYPLFSERELDMDYEFNAREDYLAELRAEHYDPFWNIDPEDDPDDSDWAAE